MIDKKLKSAGPPFAAIKYDNPDPERERAKK